MADRLHPEVQGWHPQPPPLRLCPLRPRPRLFTIARLAGFVTELPRQASWRATAPATLVWVEALDEGNPRNQAEQRDKVLMLSAPFTS